MSGIIWLASYPKSGNTWLRIFLTNYWVNGEEPAQINQLSGGPIASARKVFDENVGIESSDLTADEIDNLRPKVYNKIAKENETPQYIKIHDAYTFNLDGQAIAPRECTKATLYIIRNPLDVAVSFSHHNNAPLKRMVKMMNNPEFAFLDFGHHIGNQLRQKLLTWSMHVTSWVDTPGLNIHLVRYEDMKFKPFETFSGVIKFLGEDFDEERIEKAIKFSDFKVLQDQEKQSGFRERAPKADTFFRKGKTGSWKEHLEPEQVEQIINNHKKIMQRFGYLTKNGEPVF